MAAKMFDENRPGKAARSIVSSKAVRLARASEESSNRQTKLAAARQGKASKAAKPGLKGKIAKPGKGPGKGGKKAAKKSR